MSLKRRSLEGHVGDMSGLTHSDCLSNHFETALATDFVAAAIVSEEPSGGASTVGTLVRAATS
jgi:hypothetical protein